MNGRDRFRRVMQFESVDRVPYWEPMGIEDATVARWRREGLPGDVHLEPYFDLDPIDAAPVNDALVPAFAEEVLDYKNGVVTRRDGLGRVCRWKAGRRLEVESYPLKTRADLAELLGRLNPRSPRRFPRYWSRFLQSVEDRADPLGMAVRGPLGWMIDLAGPAWTQALVTEDPEFLAEAVEAFTAFTLELMQPVLAGVPDVDFVLIRETAFGDAFTARAFGDFAAARYLRLARAARDQGVGAIILACEGDLREVVEAVAEVGITAMAPIDAAAGMDPVALRREMGQGLAIVGGLDSRVLTRDRGAIEREITTKASALLAGGGWIPCFDHAIPPETPFDNYRIARDLIRDAAEGG